MHYKIKLFFDLDIQLWYNNNEAIESRLIPPSIKAIQADMLSRKEIRYAARCQFGLCIVKKEKINNALKINKKSAGTRRTTGSSFWQSSVELLQKHDG